MGLDYYLHLFNQRAYKEKVLHRDIECNVYSKFRHGSYLNFERRLNLARTWPSLSCPASKGLLGLETGSEIRWTIVSPGSLRRYGVD